MRRSCGLIVLLAVLLLNGICTAHPKDNGKISTIDQCVKDANASPRFTDNADGTITDKRTCLMWEKKDNARGIHDKDNVYTWSTCSEWPKCSPNGTAFTKFLATLNMPPCFAGHCDWRLPTSAGRPDWGEDFGPTGQAPELESIVAAPYPGFLSLPSKCTSSPCVDPAFNMNCGPQSSGNPGCTADGKGKRMCSCTLPQPYSSGSSFGDASHGPFPWDATVVDFQGGWVFGTSKKYFGPVRAVRDASR